MKIENGCRRHRDCFTCPFEECTYGEKHTSIDWNNKEQVSEYRRRYMREYRKKKLQQEFPFINFEG